MGYMGLERVADTDTASDLAYSVTKTMVVRLRKGLKVKENEFNTDGCINVALFFRDFIYPCGDVYSDCDELEKLALDCVTLLQEEIKSVEHDKWHLAEYRRMIKELEKWLAN